MTSNRINPDVLYPLPRVKEYLGGLSRTDIAALINSGRLKAHWRRTRGKQGRKVVFGADLLAYMKSLPVVETQQGKTASLELANLAPDRYRRPRKLKPPQMKLAIERW